ncbi:MAG: DUF3667 domain-containing protein [Pedobacter sp.]|nr:MAG: DUF3667 domain-containing protein [Pedobacter sp.]
MSSFKLRKEKDCLNCGAQVEQTYCPHCGQENIELKENALHMVVHTIADYFHFDNKFFKTLKPLLYKPGFLPTEYVKGKRASYLHPIKMYIFISIVFFIFIASNSKSDKENNAKKAETTALKKNVPDSTHNLSKRELNLAIDILDKSQLISQDLKDSLQLLNKNIQSAPKSNSTEIKDTLNKKNQFSKYNTKEAYFESQEKLPIAERDNRIVRNLSLKTIELQQKENAKELLIKELFKNVPKMMFVLLPLFAIILKIVYWRKKRYYYEHLIYSFHLHSALFLSFLTYVIIDYSFSLFYSIHTWLILGLIFYMNWYTYRSLRVFYGSSRWVTVFKFCLLGFSYIFILAFCLVGLLGISLYTV